MSKKRQIKTPLLTICIAFAAIIIAIVTHISDNEQTADKPIVVGEGEMIVHFLDAGQGDSEFIELPDGRCMLIDASIKEYGDDIADYIRSCGYDEIDYLVATHPHADHIGGMSEVVNSFDIGEIYMPKVSSDSKTFENLLTSISDKGLQISTAKAGKTIYSDSELSIDILSPADDEYESTNDYSAVIKITYGSSSFLFTGDAEELVEEQMLSTYYSDLSADVLKVGHHGSSTSSSMSFLRAVSSKYSVISCGADNSYGHPHNEVLARLSAIGTDVYRTDTEGTVTIICDGNDNFEVKCVK